MSPIQTRAGIVQELRKLRTQEMQIRDGVALLRQQQMEFRRNRSIANGWGLVAVVSKSMLIPLHVITNALELTAAQKMVQQLTDATIIALQLSHGEYRDVSISLRMKALEQAIETELESRRMAEYVPGVGILFGLAEDSASLLAAAIRVSDGANEMVEEDRAIARMSERTIERATAVLRQLQAKEASLRQAAPANRLVMRPGARSVLSSARR